MISVSVEATETSFTFGSRTRVLDWPYREGGQGRTYDVSLDGERFLAITETDFEGAAPRFIIVENWFEELKRLVPTE